MGVTKEDARRSAAQAVQYEAEGKRYNALQMYTDAVEKYLELARSTPTDQSLTMRLLARAERLQRTLAEDGEGAYPRWESKENFTLVSTPALSARQVREGASYRRSNAPIYDPMSPIRGDGITQGSVTNCSFVAAISAAAAHDTRFGTSLAHGALYPRLDAGPCAALDARHTARLYLNGYARCIAVDEKLPMRAPDSYACAMPVGRPQLWPALLEKAFLAAQSSDYDFHGSDGTADLYMLTSWIPEHIALHHASFQREKGWMRFFRAWQEGRCLLTAGTGAQIDASAAPALRELIPEHCYSVVGLCETQLERQVMLVNPWGAATLRCTWEEFCTAFDTLGVNWDPSCFAHSCTVHGSWDESFDVGLRPERSDVALSDQYQLDVPPETQVWIHLERHKGYSSTSEPEYIALHAFLNNIGERRAQVERGGDMGTYLDGRHTLLRIPEHSRAVQYALAVSRHGPAIRPYPSYTVHVYAQNPVSMYALHHNFPFHCVVHGKWQGRAAAGNSHSPCFRHNPQFRVVVRDAPGTLPRLQALLTTDSDIPVHIDMLRSQSQRVTSIDTRTLLASSGAYTHGLALCNLPAIQPGTSTLIASTFEPHKASFTLHVYCTNALDLEPIPAEGAGMYHRSASPRTPPCWNIAVQRTATISLVVAARGQGPRLALCDSQGGCVTQSGPTPEPCSQLTAKLECGAYTLTVSDTPISVDVYSTEPCTLT
ncbi:cysteine protease [Malassezia vespertilionis]|uniref:cysteine protease n=1 Tax=Malassezia vespertilionis TaxID=2020962 RepID=UPI0024B12228|nr:cysteine protease [Malassezia vespertilionis]WFD04838.1 cysteine protease [Malassezia vespertilionis]